MLAADGYELFRGVAGPDEVHALREELAPLVDAGRGGVRNLLDHPVVHRWAADPRVREMVEPVLGASALAVRAILFDKTPDANWKVTWHQDVTIAVSDRIEVKGFGPWSLKEEVWHVRPPVAVLEGMLAVRLHLDPCREENGPVRVVPGSHLEGLLREADYDECRARRGEVVCVADEGDVLLMRPLLLHASSPAQVPRHRRVLHIEFAGGELPPGLAWRWADPPPSRTTVSG